MLRLLMDLFARGEDVNDQKDSFTLLNVILDDLFTLRNCMVEPFDHEPYPAWRRRRLRGRSSSLEDLKDVEEARRSEPWREK